MKKNLVAITTFVVLCLISLATPALSYPIGLNFIFAINGNVQIKRHSEAEPLFKQSLQMIKRLLGKEDYNVAVSLNNLASLYQNQGRYPEAEPLFKQSLQMIKRLLGKEHPDVAFSLNNLAELYQLQGRYKEAEPLYKQSLEMIKRLLGKQNPNVANSLNNLARLYTKQGRYSEAEPLYQQSLGIYKQNFGNEHLIVANSLNNLASLFVIQERYSEAEPLLKQSLEIRKRLLGNEHPDVAFSLNNLAILYTKEGRYSEAEPLLKQSLEIRKRLLGKEHLDVAVSLNDLAGLYRKQGRYSEAEPLYQQSLEMRKRLLGKEHPDVAFSLYNLASLYENQGQYSEAESLYKQSLEMRKRLLGKEHPDVAVSLNDLASLYQNQGRYSEAEPLYQKFLEIIKRLLGKEHPDVAVSLNNLALLYENQGNITKTLKFFKQGLEVEEHNLAVKLSVGFERQKRDYISTISGSKYRIISLHLNSALNNPKAANLALTTILRRKRRILDILTNNLQILRQRVNDKYSARLIDELSDSYTQLANLIYNPPEKLPPKEYRQQLADLEEKTKRKEDELSRRSREFAKLSQPVKLEDIQKLIPADAALVEIVTYKPLNPKARQNQRFGKPHYAAYILKSTGKPQAINLGEAGKIEKALKSFRDSLRDSSTPSKQVQESARNIDKLVMQPIRKLLGNKRKILISPDGKLNLIPFEALVDENNRYLVENYSFTYLTSGRDLLRLQNKYPSKQPPMVIADPFFDKQGEIVALKPNKPNNTRSIDLSKTSFPPLEGTRQEAESIAQILEVKPLLGTKASEGTIKQLQSPKILHIATHGFFESYSKTSSIQNTYQDNPLLLSGLVLSGYKNKQGGGNEDGILTALETTSLNLTGTKLVVLSACDTGVGQNVTGEGIYSLRRALVIAGSESQVISLWKVDDNATKDLMIAYFQKILGKNGNKQGRSEALHQVQLEMLRGEKYKHPYYWAAFIPSGDWRRMDSTISF